MSKILDFNGSLLTGTIRATFFKDVNIIVGCNGSGKTLLLEALAEYAKKSNISCAYWEGLFSPPGTFTRDEKLSLLRSFAKMLAMKDEKLEKGMALWGFILFGEIKPPVDKPDKWDKWNKALTALVESHGSGQRFFDLLQFVVDNKDKKVLLIDNIETGLHLELQEHLIDLIHHLTNAQLFITTHSPDIVKEGYMGKTLGMDALYEKNQKNELAIPEIDLGLHA